MTATEAPPPVKAPVAAPPMRRLLVFGSGLGIFLGPASLDAVIVRSRPSGPAVVAATSILDFRLRPAAEWGAELSKFLELAREPHLTATVLLPRDEVIVRTIHLPGVSQQEAPGAIELQLDTLHPYGDEEVASAWMSVGNGHYVIGMVRKSVLDAWETLFSEAGISVAAFSFSAAAIHAALRIWQSGPGSVLALCGRTEVYGESESRPLYSAEFTVAPERAVALSRAELRLLPQFGALPLGEVLPKPSRGGEGISPLAYAASLAASTPLISRFANLLPAERRASSARRQYLLPAILGGLVVVALIVVFAAIPAMEQRSYSAALSAEIRRLEPAAQRAQALEKTAAANRNRVLALDEIRRRPQADLDILNELTRLLPPAVWTNSIEIYPDSVVISGEADQAAPLLKILDSSPLFQNSEFALSVTHNAQNEQFRIKSMRRGRGGRTTP